MTTREEEEAISVFLEDVVKKNARAKHTRKEREYTSRFLSNDGQDESVFFILLLTINALNLILVCFCSYLAISFNDQIMGGEKRDEEEIFDLFP